MVSNPFEVLRKSEAMCREIYGILKKNGERADFAVWFQYIFDPDTIVVRMSSVGSLSIKEIFDAGYYLHIFGADYGYVELWISKI